MADTICLAPHNLGTSHTAPHGWHPPPQDPLIPITPAPSAPGATVNPRDTLGDTGCPLGHLAPSTHHLISRARSQQELIEG